MSLAVDQMKIGLNATCFNDRPSGAKQRFVGIYSELIKCMPDHEFIIFEPADTPVSEWFEGMANVTSIRTNLPSEGRIKKFILGRGYWSSALSGKTLDIFECFNLPLVRSPAGMNVLTIHDIRGVNANCGKLEKILFNNVLKKSIREADHVVTVSHAMKDEILSLFPDVSISVVYNGLNAYLFSEVKQSDLDNFRKKYISAGEFLLAVGHFEKRKNYHQLVKAISILRDRGLKIPLLIIGNDSGERAVIEKKIDSENLADYVTIISGLSDVEVRCAYKLCSLFVFPSSYEGFGIPILEAMAAGCPMVLSDIPVFREITDDKGDYFTHNDPEHMALMIESTLSSESECKRLVEYGKVRVNEFGFQKLALQMKHFYETLR